MRHGMRHGMGNGIAHSPSPCSKTHTKKLFIHRLGSFRLGPQRKTDGDCVAFGGVR